MTMRENSTESCLYVKWEKSLCPGVGYAVSGPDLWWETPPESSSLVCPSPETLMTFRAASSLLPWGEAEQFF